MLALWNDWLIDWLFDWLFDWVDQHTLPAHAALPWQVNWLFDWLINWSSDCLQDVLARWDSAQLYLHFCLWIFDWLIDWIIAWLLDWLFDWLMKWLPTGCVGTEGQCWTVPLFLSLIVWLFYCFIDWLSTLYRMCWHGGTVLNCISTSAKWSNTLTSLSLYKVT